MLRYLYLEMLGYLYLEMLGYLYLEMLGYVRQCITHNSRLNQNIC